MRIEERTIGAWIPDKETLVAMGSENLKIIKAELADRTKELTWRLEKTKSLVEALDGKTVEDIKAIAAGYEHPEFPGAGREPGPDDAKSILRKAGATTFNFCGWCNHHDGGWAFYEGYSGTDCCYKPKEDDDDDDGTFKYRFNTPCMIANGTQELLDSCLARVKGYSEELTQKKAIIDKNTEIVDDAIAQTERKPCFVGWRPSEWVQRGDEVVCFISKSTTPDAIDTGIFVAGQVIDSYVTVYTEKVCTRGKAFNGHGLRLGKERPEIMRKWEYEYLKTHPEYRKMWLENAGFNDWDHWDPDEMAAAFENVTL